METLHSPRWRSYLLLIVAAIGGLMSLGGALVLFGMGIYAKINSVAEMQPLNLVLLGWISLVPAIFCVLGVVVAAKELNNRPLSLPKGRGLVLASLGLVVWALVAAVFNTVETSSYAIYALPPLVLLAASLPLWWYIEYARFGLSDRQPSRKWGLASFSFSITMPVVLLASSVVLIAVFAAVIVYVYANPDLALQFQHLGMQLQGADMDPQVLSAMMERYMQNPLLIAGLLTVIAGLLPLVEELLKTLALWLYAGDGLTPAEGFVSGLICGGSFALWENLSVLSSVGDGSGTSTLLVRAGTGLLHVTTAAMIGWGIASAVQSRGGIWKLVVTYISAALLHCSWNAASVFVGVGNVINPPTQELFSANWISTAAFVALGVLMLLNFLILTVFNRKLRPPRPAYPLYPPAEDQTLAPAPLAVAAEAPAEQPASSSADSAAPETQPATEPEPPSAAQDSPDENHEIA